MAKKIKSFHSSPAKRFFPNTRPPWSSISHVLRHLSFFYIIPFGCGRVVSVVVWLMMILVRRSILFLLLSFLFYCKYIFHTVQCTALLFRRKKIQIVIKNQSCVPVSRMAIFFKLVRGMLLSQSIIRWLRCGNRITLQDFPPKKFLFDCKVKVVKLVDCVNDSSFFLFSFFENIKDK
jgi:hypothetical protein